MGVSTFHGCLHGGQGLSAASCRMATGVIIGWDRLVRGQTSKIFTPNAANLELVTVLHLLSHPHPHRLRERYWSDRSLRRLPKERQSNSLDHCSKASKHGLLAPFRNLPHISPSQMSWTGEKAFSPRQGTRFLAKLAGSTLVGTVLKLLAVLVHAVRVAVLGVVEVCVDNTIR